MSYAGQVLADFPGLNFIRLNVYSYQSPDAYSAFIKTMTAAGVVVELEDHANSSGSNAGGGVGDAFTGFLLTNEMDWFSSVASAFASNPYVWFGTNNEPPAAGLDAWEQQTYNAVRGTGNHSPVMIELPGGGYPGSTASGYGMDPNIFTSMTNIVLDPHYYGWDSGYSTDQQTVNASLTSLVQGAQSLRSADGIIPAIIGEYGPSTDGSSTDGNGSQVLQAVLQSTVTSGSAAWGWNSGANDNLTDGSGNLTSYGQEVAGSFNTNAASKPPSPVATVTPSADNTVIKAGSTAAIVDASGNEWTITSGGQVAVNDVAEATTTNVVEIAKVGGTIWQENTANLWWGKTSPTDSWNGETATSPLPANVTIPQSQTNATISASGVTVTATAGNHMVLISGQGDTVSLSDGNNSITDTGGGNTFVIPAAGKGYDTFTNNILTNGDTLDLRTVLAATKWDGAASTLSKYLVVTNTANAAVLQIAPGGPGMAILTINGAQSSNLAGLLAHAIT